MRTWRLITGLSILLLPGLMLAPAWSLAGLGAGEDDVLYYYPTRVLFHDTVSAGDWPWLNPWTGLGRPFAADPQTAVWYPFTWLFAFLPPLLAYPASLWAHYSLALWGMYRLLRALSLDRRASLFGGIAFAFCGFMLAHRAHLTMQHAAAWTPWVLCCLYRYTLDAPSPQGRRARPSAAERRSRGLRRLAAAAAVLAAQCFSGHVQVAAITAVGALVFLAACGPHRARSRVIGPGHLRVATRWLIACVCAGGLFAVQWLPTFDYVRFCTRIERTYADFVENSWHPVSAVGWLLPMLFGQRTPDFFDQPYWGPSHQVEQFTYMGLLPLVLAALALRAGWGGDPRRRPLVVLGVFGLLLALGQYGPLCPFLYWVPGSSLFRCPARAMLLVNISIAGLAAVTLHDLGARASPQRARLRALAIGWTRRPLLTGVALVGIPLLIVLAALPLVDAETRAAALRAVQPWSSAVWTPLVVALVTLAALGAAVRNWRRPGLLWLLIGLTALDLGVIGWTIDVPARHTTPNEMLTSSQPADWMDAVRTSSQRLWVVTGRQDHKPGEYADPIGKAVADTNILREITTLTDYGPLQPRAIVERFGFKPWGETDEATSLLADTRWMRLYDVGWILLCDGDRPPPADCDLFATTAAGWRVFHNPTACGWAFFEAPDQPGAVHYVRHSPARFTTWADTWPSQASRNTKGAAAQEQNWPRLVVSQLALPGWSARLNGQPATIETIDGVLMGVRVPPGAAVEIAWSYNPPGWWAGAAISLVCAAVLVAAVLRKSSRQ